MSFKNQIDPKRLPAHVAIIMDGNGRWAKQKGFERNVGHQHGVISATDVVEAAREIGIEYITLYTFSTENWNRPKDEVDALMTLLVDSIHKETQRLIDNNIRLLVAGNINALPEICRTQLAQTMELTKHKYVTSLVLALSYSSRWEILEAVRKMSIDAKNNTIDPENIDDNVFSSYLTTAGIPDPELLIRTSGEYRISNFLLWQIAYAELYFTDVLWPDFRKENFFEAIVDYQKRERRFGKTSEQIEKNI